MLAILALARLSGLRRGPIKWPPVAWGLGLMLGMACLVFLVPAGRQGLLWLNDVVMALLAYSRSGVLFLFGPLGLGPGQTGPAGEQSIGFILALQYLPTIVFFMAASALLYQAGILQRIVSFFARVFARLLGTSGAESLGVASTIFVGIETAGMIRPYLKNFTRSEFFCLLTALMATVASSTMGVYVGVLSGTFPNIAGHLMSASLISAPAAIVVAKLMEPETGEPLTLGQRVDLATGRYGGYMEAVVTGSTEGVKLVVGVAALLLSFLGLVAVAEGLVSWLGGLLGWQGITFSGLLGYLAWPLALAMGIPPADASQVAGLLGQRLLVTEIPTYVGLAELLNNGQLHYWRSPLIASYALCGFTHVGSVAVFTGGLAALVPERMSELSRMGLKALWAATLATALTGCVAGVFAAGGNSLLGIIP
jgi:CNT family concentrative nucleoside transporter